MWYGSYVTDNKQEPNSVGKQTLKQFNIINLPNYHLKTYISHAWFVYNSVLMTGHAKESNIVVDENIGLRGMTMVRLTHTV